MMIQREIEMMLQICYKVGGPSITAAEIKFVILKTKIPVFQPQLVQLSSLFDSFSIYYTSHNVSYYLSPFRSLLLAFHKFKIYSIDSKPKLIGSLRNLKFSSEKLKYILHPSISCYKCG